MVCGGSNRRAEAWRWVTHLGQATGTPLSAGLVCATAVARLGVDGAVVALDTGDGWPEIRHATGELAWSLTELQATVGEGPYTDARTLGAPVLVGDLDAETSQRRWPLFAPLAVEAGAHALFTLPLRVGAIRVGALALHRVRAGDLASTGVGDALVLADLALGLLLDEQAGLPAGAMATDGPTLLTPQVHQATGMIAARFHLSMADAFARLRAKAFAERRPLAALATDVVYHRVRFAPTDETS